MKSFNSKERRGLLAVVLTAMAVTAGALSLRYCAEPRGQQLPQTVPADTVVITAGEDTAALRSHRESRRKKSRRNRTDKKRRKQQREASPRHERRILRDTVINEQL